MKPGIFGNVSKREILGYIADIIAIGGLLYGGVRIIRGDIGLITLILLIVCACGIWLSSFFFYIRRGRYRRWVGGLALALIIAMPALTIASYLGWRYYKNLTPDKVIILLADFDGPDRKKYRVTGNIKDQLEEATKKYPDIEVELLNESITYESPDGYARKVGKEKKASIVLWGEYTVNEENVQMIAHFEVLEKPAILELKQEVENMTVEAVELRNFTIQEQLSGQMTYLVLMTIGLARYEAEDHEEAIGLFSDAINEKNIPEGMIEPAAIYFYRGNAYNFNGDLDAGIKDFDKAIEINPGLAEAYNNRGIAYTEKGDADAAIRDFDKAIDIDPGIAQAYFNRGYAHHDKRDFDAAIKDLTKSIEIRPDYYGAYNNRGISYTQKLDFDSAIKDFDKAIELVPDSAYAYNNRGNVYILKIEFDRAIEDFTKAIKINPELGDAYKNRGIARYYQYAFDPAIKDLTVAIKINPSDVNAYYVRGLCYAEKDKDELAVGDFEKVLELSGNPNLKQKAGQYIEELQSK